MATKYIQVSQARYAEHCEKSNEKQGLTSDVLLWYPTNGKSSVDWLAKNLQFQICADVGYRLDEFSRNKDWDRESWKTVVVR